MFLNFEGWEDVIASLLGGGFAGATVVGLLFKFLIKNQLEKSLKQYQHDLDTRKDTLQAELAVFTEHAKLRVTNYRQKSINALEAVYGGFVRTSLPRHGFKKTAPAKMPEEKANSEYFRLFSENFQAFDRAFQSVQAGFACLEENVIYLDSELEIQVVVALREVNSYYQKRYGELSSAHQAAQRLFEDNALGKQQRSVDFDQFHAGMCADWSKIAGPVTAALKAKARELLSPKDK